MGIETHPADAGIASRKIAEAIANEKPIDWSLAERALGADAHALSSFRLLDDVATAFRSVNDQMHRPKSVESLFTWGPLEVVEPLGEGQTGQVFRAFDPTLRRDVALKLCAQRDPLSDPGNMQVLGEARQLARIRHRNVLAIFGAAIHDGRAGIWSELIEGRTLAEIVAAEGTFALDEVISIGLDVCRALGIVHAAGIVHGDVKAENVMRERAGRIVLMDFGASGDGEDLATRSIVSGTRNYLAPEILAGAAPSAHSDIYALGVLLHFLLTGAFPRDTEGRSVALAQFRPDLSVESCLKLDALVANDPSMRPRDAAALARILFGLLPTRAEPGRSSRRTRWISTIAVVLSAFAIAIAASALRTPAWQMEARFVNPGNAQPVVYGSAVQLGDRLALNLQTTRATYVYVLNEDADGELNVLFPLAGLDQGNPLPAGRDLELPGTAKGQAMNWEISSPSASEEFLMIASPMPLANLEQYLLAAARAEIPAGRDSRGVNQLQPALPRGHELQGTHLLELVALARREVTDGESVRFLSLRVPHAQLGSSPRQ